MNRKKIFLEIVIFILITVLAVIGYHVTATVTTEMASEGIGYPSGYPVITYNDLIKQFNLLCSGHDIALPGEASTVVTSGDYSRAIPVPEEDEIAFTTGEVGYRRNPYSATTSKTLGRYTSSGPVTAVPEEAYILSEMTENTNGNTATVFNRTNRKYTGEINSSYEMNINGETVYGVDIDDNGQPKDYVLKEGNDYFYIETASVGSDYFPYTYVQQAWWSTPAGSKGTPVKQNSFSSEAKAFEIYLNSVRNGSGTTNKTVTVNGKTVTVPAPEIKFNVSSIAKPAKFSERFLFSPILI